MIAKYMPTEIINRHKMTLILNDNYVITHDNCVTTNSNIETNFATELCKIL